MAKTEEPAPKKQRFAQLRQIKQVYDMTRQVNPAITWLMLGAFLAVTALFVLVGMLIGYPVYLGIIGSMFGILAATFLLTRKAQAAAYKMIEGKPGQSMAAIQGLRRGHWSYDDKPVAMDAGRSQAIEDTALVFRAVGLPGVILVGEGPIGKTQKLLTTEKKKVERILPNVPVFTYRTGNDKGPDVVPTPDLAGKLQKLPKTLTKDEVGKVSKRLKAMTGLRPPVPQGIDPNRIRQMGRGGRR